MKKLYLFKILVFIVLYNIANAQPSITSFAPASGPVGTTVTISGTNFNTTPGNNIVFFGATMANVSSATSTSLTVAVPVSANYQAISITDLATNLTAYSSQPFIVISPCGGNINASSFAPKLDSATGVNPICVSMGDLNSDGKPDLVVANKTGNTISIYKNISSVGIISFESKVDLVTGIEPFSVAIGDLDGDGKLDISVTNYSANSVSIFLNTSSIGNISFFSHIDFTTGMNPRNVSIGDIDGDGKPELVIVNNFNGIGGNSISVLKNTGTLGVISFATKIDFNTGSLPYSAAILDLNGDGRLDIAVTNYSSVSRPLAASKRT